MPIYEYQCEKCNNTFEVFHRMGEEINPACPKCLGQARKIMSATNFILKGSGFYVNDYPSESRRKAKKEETEAGKPSDKLTKPESQKKKAGKNP